MPETAMTSLKANESSVLLWIPPHHSHPRGAAELLLAALLFVILFFVACDSERNDAPSYAGLFEVEVAGEERFLLALASEDQVEMAMQRMQDGTVGVIHGSVVRGDGGFNDPYDWHLDPATVTFPDLAMEVCDGRPQFVQDDLDYWVDTIQYYCPWGAQIVRRVE